jgi:hypothetical protein
MPATSVATSVPNDHGVIQRAREEAVAGLVKGNANNLGRVALPAKP